MNIIIVGGGKTGSYLASLKSPPADQPRRHGARYRIEKNRGAAS